MEREFPLGSIQAFSGAIVDIPRTWRLCDGTLKTPDLRNKFVVGSGDAYAPGGTGGAINHNHPFTAGFHLHELAVGEVVDVDIDRNYFADTRFPAGTTDLANGLAPYYALAYIMYAGRVH